MQEFDIDAFLNDLRGAQPVVLMTLLYHFLKISQSINLVALSEGLALNLSDVQYIRRGHDEQYFITFKSDPNACLYVYRDTPEYTSLVTLLHVFNRSPEH